MNASELQGRFRQLIGSSQNTITQEQLRELSDDGLTESDISTIAFISQALTLGLMVHVEALREDRQQGVLDQSQNAELPLQYQVNAGDHVFAFLNAVFDQSEPFGPVALLEVRTSSSTLYANAAAIVRTSWSFGNMDFWIGMEADPPVIRKADPINFYLLPKDQLLTALTA